MSQVSYSRFLQDPGTTTASRRSQKVLLTGVLLLASFNPASGGIHESWTSTPANVKYCLSHDASSDVDAESNRIVGRIQQVADRQDLRDDDEIAPPPIVVTSAKEMVQATAILMDRPMLPAIVSTFFGELNLTWRSGDDIVRVAFFPDRPSLIQRVNLSQPLGSYRSETNPTPEILAAELDQLALQDVGEAGYSLG